MSDESKRFFGQRQRDALFVVAGGQCEGCGTPLEEGWHADHSTPYSRGGPTDVINGRALCPRCNLMKGNKMVMRTNETETAQTKIPFRGGQSTRATKSSGGLRVWQQRFLHEYLAKGLEEFFLVAFPATGKTTAMLAAARRLKDQGVIDHIAVVVPGSDLKEQWAETAWKRFGLELQHDYEATLQYPCRKGKDGVVVTYSAVASQPDIFRAHCSRLRTIAIFDEPHHQGTDMAWGDATKHAFEPAIRKLSGSGTPWRSDKKEIPFVRYEPVTGDDNEVKYRVCADFSYTYVDALKDGFCREAIFPKYDAEYLKWRDRSTGEIVEYTFKDDVSYKDAQRRLRTASTASTGFMDEIIKDAHAHLETLRLSDSRTGALLIARDTDEAYGFAKRIKDLCGVDPVVVTSKNEDGSLDNKAAKRLKDFKKSSEPWIVAVHMVSEGVDIPRLRVLVYATNVTTPIYFCQALGRIIRVTEDDNGQVIGGVGYGYLFIPDDLRLMHYAATIKQDVDHYVKERDSEEDKEDDDKDGGDGSGTGERIFGIDPIAGKGMTNGVIYDGATYDERSRVRVEELRNKYPSFKGVPDAEMLQFVREEAFRKDVDSMEAGTHVVSGRQSFEQKEAEEKSFRSLLLKKVKTCARIKNGGYSSTDKKIQAGFAREVSYLKRDIEFIGAGGKMLNVRIAHKAADLDTIKGRIAYVEELTSQLKKRG